VPFTFLMLPTFRDPAGILAALEGALARSPVAVIGDLMLDRHVWGEVSRISPEAPVPVVSWRRQNEVLGGAGNVVANLAGLGVPVSLAAAVGRDADGRRAGELLATLGVSAAGLIPTDARPTTAKVRIIAGHQQVVRLDIEDPAPLAAEVRRACFAALGRALPQARAVVLSDYAKGLFDTTLCQQVITAAVASGAPVLVDPKGRDFTRYRGATVLKPNRAELADVCAIPSADLEALLHAAAQMRRNLALGAIVLTLGAQGTALIDAEGTIVIPAEARDVFDVTGAGDTMIATLAAALAAGLSLRDGVALANQAAAIVVGKVGTAPVTAGELLARVRTPSLADSQEKVFAPSALGARVALWRGQGARVVFTNGCFDILHAGHVAYLEYARRQGDRLIVALNTDRSVRALKGPGRPITAEHDRARILAALAAVDAVVLFDQATPLDLVTALRPDVLVKGADYQVSQVVGAAEVESWGGRVVLAPLTEGLSTTRSLERARSSGGVG
jgi:D-beta-D-heptose 7-phosphate kinase/D-beta-D-heptose 1-phosphate adenosyltransferase